MPLRIQPGCWRGRAQLFRIKNMNTLLKRFPGFAAATVTALFTLAASARAEVTIPDEYRIGGFAIGCQAYSFNRYTAFEAIEKTAAAGGRVIEFFPGQRLNTNDPMAKLDHNSMSDEQIAALKAKLEEHKIRAVNYGVVGLPNDEAQSRKVFEFAKKLGLRAVTSEPKMEAMDLLEKLVKEFDVMLAIHNHPNRPNDDSYKVWDPNYVLSMVKDRDPRLGACADTGHWVRSGIKPVDALRILKGRVISSHLKDLHEFKRSGHDMPYGLGFSDVPGILDELHAQGFKGNISIEYEYNWTASVPEIAQCIGFVRGYTRAKGW